MKLLVTWYTLYSSTRLSEFDFFLDNIIKKIWNSRKILNHIWASGQILNDKHVILSIYFFFEREFSPSIKPGILEKNPDQAR